MGSLTSCDPTDIMNTIKSLAKEKIKSSVISLAAEIQVCKTLAKLTNGTFQVVLSEPHFKELMSDQLVPPALESETAQNTNMILMGFPGSISSNAALCAW